MPRHHQKSSAGSGSQRQLRVGETVRHAVAEILAFVYRAQARARALSQALTRSGALRSGASGSYLPLGGLVLADSTFAGLEALTAFTLDLVLATGALATGFFATGIDSKSKAAGLQSQ